jgi:demethylmenaquinone methyltransferase/2-methoxy-6-polyprenyl-1,4-benzoquinol methylase
MKNDTSCSPLIYEWTIEPFLKGIKRKTAELVSRYDLYPVLDLCCGTGKQGHLIGLKEKGVFGLDKNLHMLFYAQRKDQDVRWVCADAASVPFRDGAFKGIILSYALHEKPEKTRKKIMKECRRLLSPEGHIFFIDYENPWNGRSRMGGVFTWLIERAAGGEHYKNGRQFLRQGGLRSFLQEYGLIEVKSYDLEMANSRIVVAKLVASKEWQSHFS